MSTFFEKLTTGSRTAPAKVPQISITPPSKEREERPVKKEITPPQAEEPRHLKIEMQNEEEETSPPPPAEEEGELTVDIYDTGDKIVIQSTVAGVKPEDLDISITDDTVIIRGRRERMEKVEEKNYYYKELFWGTFSRTIILPEEVEDEAAEAQLKHGLLTVALPKKKRGVTQKLKVRVT